MDDRRRYFRINDKISLKYRVVQGIDIETEMKRTEYEQNDLAEIKNAFNCIEAKIISKMARIEEVSPMVAEVLGLYDKKLSLIESMIFHKDDEKKSISETRRISSLSSRFILIVITRFARSKMELILFPEYQLIPLYARVIECKKKLDDNLYRFNIYVDFVGISESDQETIMQHILNLQAASIKKERREQKAVSNA